MPPRLVPQLALDEQAITNADLEAALEKRLRASDDASEAKGVKKVADQAVNAILSTIDFPPDSALRVGRFRITKTHLEARRVEFDSSASDRVRITLADDGAAPAKAAPTKAAGKPKATGSFSGKPAKNDEKDLRPTGDVNPDALRGEADRASLN